MAPALSEGAELRTFCGFIVTPFYYYTGPNRGNLQDFLRLVELFSAYCGLVAGQLSPFQLVRLFAVLSAFILDTWHY